MRLYLSLIPDEKTLNNLPIFAISVRQFVIKNMSRNSQYWVAAYLLITDVLSDDWTIDGLAWTVYMLWPCLKDVLQNDSMAPVSSSKESYFRRIPDESVYAKVTSIF